MTNELHRLELSRFVSENSFGYTDNLLSEAVQTNISDAVLSKMFELTIGKYNKIDFSEIEKSRGDVTKIKYYKNLRECINTLIDIHEVTNKIPAIIVVSDALNNLYSMKNTFEYNFRIKNNAAIMIYNSIMYAIMMSTSYIIAASIDISKTETVSGANTVNVYNMDPKSLCLIKSLNSFNACVADGSLLKFVKEAAEQKNVQSESIDVITEDSSLLAGLAKKAGTAAIEHLPEYVKKHPAKTAGFFTLGVFAVYLGVRIVPIIREIVYWIYKSRQKISDAAALQAKFMELNIESLEGMDPNAIAGRTKIMHRPITSEQLITKQNKWVDRFNRISEKFALDSDKASRDAKIDINKDKVDVSDIVI